MSEGTQDRAIGRLEGKVDTLLVQLERSEAIAKDSRSKVYERIEANSRQVAEMMRTLQHIDGRVAAVEASASAAHEKASAVKERLDGLSLRAAKLMGIGTGVGVGFGLSFDTIKNWLFGPPHS